MGIPPLPLPPADLHDRPLPTQVIPAASHGFRCHDPAFGPLWFGPRGLAPQYRFDDPDGGYKVCYIGGSRLTAFVETFLRELPTRTVTELSVKARAISTIEIVRDIVTVPAYGKGLAQLGTTAAIGGAKLSGATNAYVHSQAWSHAIYHHPDGVDGIEFRSSHDDDLHCLALFDRAQGTVADGNKARTVWDDKKLLLKAIRRYRLELI